MEINIEVNTKLENQMGMEFTLGQMDVSMKAILSVDSSMVKENGGKYLIYLVLLLTNITASTFKIKNVAKANLNGQVEIFTKDSTKMTREKATGR
jgi:hypothetical protein